jgi:hypothetical protein
MPHQAVEGPDAAEFAEGVFHGDESKSATLIDETHGGAGEIAAHADDTRERGLERSCAGAPLFATKGNPALQRQAGFSRARSEPGCGGQGLRGRPSITFLDHRAEETALQIECRSFFGEVPPFSPPSHFTVEFSTRKAPLTLSAPRQVVGHSPAARVGEYQQRAPSDPGAEQVPPHPHPASH